MRTLAVTLACLAAVVAGCGGSKSPSVANIGTTATTPTGTSTTGSSTPSAVAFATCMGSHGFTASVGSAASAPGPALHVAGVTFAGKVDPGSPQFQSAMQACRKYLPGGGPPSMTPAQRAVWARGMAQFAACMRKHGAPNFPTPQLGKPPAGNGVDLNSALVQGAFADCQSLEPKVGPRIDLGR